MELHTRFVRLEEALSRLTEAQVQPEERARRLEEAVTRLTEGQRELQMAVIQLTKAQTQTDRTLQQLTCQVGGLSETVGGNIEDIAYIVLYDVLKREFGWEVQPLERVFQEWNGELVEVNIFGQAIDPTQQDRPYWIIGKVKHNLTLKEVERF